MLRQEVYCAIGFAFLAGLGCLSNYLTHYINVQVLSEENEKNQPEAFIATRVYNDLKVLNDFGPKATGSDANEIHTVNFLMKQLETIRSDNANVADISLDLQVVSGVHFVSAHYVNIQNVIAKLHGESETTVMINCHFDSEAGSYGAGDDGVNCCIMLEILRKMAMSGKKGKHSTLFLFNGSEEGNLEGVQASHAFITQHKWAKDVKAFVNLEAQGIGGREMLFRSGPRHDWLIEKYRQAVTRPFGQVFAEEMFETNVLNSGTDFESFRDAGNVPGLDISYCNGGWKYHTEFDHIRYMTNDSIQNTGNNILPLVKLLANSDELSNPPEGTAAVYYDFWGLFLVSYSATAGKVINIVVSILAVLIPFLVQTELKISNIPRVLRTTLASFVIFTISAILSLSACFGMGLIMNATDNAMFWFNATILSLGVYSVLAIIVQIAVYHVSFLITRKLSKEVNKGDEKFAQRKRLHAQLNGVNLFWAVLTIAITSFGLRFAYIIMILLLISLVTNVLMYCMHMALPATRLHSWIFIHFAGHSFSFLWSTYLLLNLWKIFIPISEKTFHANPEAVISLLCGLISLLSLSYFIPLTSLLRIKAVLYTTLISTFVLCLVLSFTPAGFPYSGSIAEPRVQRHYITHTKRAFYDAGGAVKFTDIGYFIKENERNSKRTLNLVLEPDTFSSKNNDVMCQTEAFCGFPSYNASDAFWMKAKEPPALAVTSLKRTSRTVNGDEVEMSFEVFGSLLTLLYVAPEPGVQLAESSVGLNQFEWTAGRIAHYLKITYGKPATEPFLFTLKLKKENSKPNDLLKVTIVTIDSHFDKSPRAKEFQSLIKKFPSYTFIQSHQADVSSFTFQ